ncbi:WXG100 family type VII secretion target [Microbacterium sp. Clip185]|uniref:WXG100 family type VII secretion target n=1 Tax=Microbacterium sp. Clip185 TaxID=3025663 RepID=UPI00236525E5|nr:WXG100 family type VII secretion target [Microbacterium sp. Clip185]WDG19396.1 WXG100 family type VII secretion target [Microbacterium sp. Clip185]
MTDISVRPEHVESTGSVVDEGASGIAQQVQALDNARSQLLGQWTGDAADAYATAQAGWIRDMSVLAEVGHRAAEAARTAAEAYIDADNAVGRLWGI